MARLSKQLRFVKVDPLQLQEFLDSAQY